MKKKRTSEDDERLGLRIDPALKTRMERARQRLKEKAREAGERAGDISLKSIAQDGVNFYLDHLEHKGDQIIRDVTEIIALGSDRTQRMLLSYIEECKMKAQAEAARRSPKTAG